MNIDDIRRQWAPAPNSEMDETLTRCDLLHNEFFRLNDEAREIGRALRETAAVATKYSLDRDFSGEAEARQATAELNDRYQLAAREAERAHRDYLGCVEDVEKQIFTLEQYKQQLQKRDHTRAEWARIMADENIKKFRPRVVALLGHDFELSAAPVA